MAKKWKRRPGQGAAPQDAKSVSPAEYHTLCCLRARVSADLARRVALCEPELSELVRALDAVDLALLALDAEARA